MSEIFAKILKDKNGNVVNVGSKYTQPEWGAETAIVDILPETTVTGEGDEWVLLTPFTNVPEVGKTYIVNWKGTEYECVGQEMDVEGTPMTVLGNAVEMGLTGNNEPFLILCIPVGMVEAMDGVHAVVNPLDGSTGSVTMSIKGEGEIIHGIPSKYISDSAVTILFNSEDSTYSCNVDYDEFVAALAAGMPVCLQNISNGTCLAHAVAYYVHFDSKGEYNDGVPCYILAFFTSLVSTTAVAKLVYGSDGVIKAFNAD